MAKSTRPDIQVLEDRVTRLKSQISEYTDLRLYRVTKQRLAQVYSELESCLEILDGVLESESNSVPRSSISALTECPNDHISEFSIDGDISDDLTDTFVVEPKEAEHHSAKEIVKTHSQRIQDCADTVGCSSGIIQVNQFCQLLNSWYQTRFAPSSNRNPGFFFKAARIPEWIDLLITAAGEALHSGVYPDFVSEMSTWIADLNTDRDQLWVLPYNVMQLKESAPTICTKEAIVLEKIVKPSIYDESFYKYRLHSIEDAYVHNSGTDPADLTLGNIIQDCPRLIVTSSFDSAKYTEP